LRAGATAGATSLIQYRPSRETQNPRHIVNHVHLANIKALAFEPIANADQSETQLPSGAGA